MKSRNQPALVAGNLTVRPLGQQGEQHRGFGFLHGAWRQSQDFSEVARDLLQICLASFRMPISPFNTSKLVRRENGTSCTSPVRGEEWVSALLWYKAAKGQGGHLRL